MKKIIRQMDGFYSHNVYHGHTDRMYIEKKCWHVLNGDGLLGSDLCQGKNN